MQEETFGMFGTVTLDQAEKHKADLKRAEEQKKKTESKPAKPEPDKPKASTENIPFEKGE